MPINPLTSDPGVCILIHFSNTLWNENTITEYSVPRKKGNKFRFNAFKFDNCSEHNIHLNWLPCRAVHWIRMPFSSIQFIFVEEKNHKRNNTRKENKGNKWTCDHTIIERLLINYAHKIQTTNLNINFTWNWVRLALNRIGFHIIDDRIIVYFECMSHVSHVDHVHDNGLDQPIWSWIFYRIPLKLLNNWTCNL